MAPLEEPPTNWWNRDNPLNNGLGSGGGSGLGSYGSVVTAAYYVALNLKNPAYGYPAIAHDLRTSAPVPRTDLAIWRSSWAAGHYGRGADWGTSPVPSVPSPADAWRSPTRCPIPYPAGVIGPCGRGFATTGSTWHSGAPKGIRGQELWAFSSGAEGQDTATWAASLPAGAYRVSAFLPDLFSDANVTYVVTDARGTHRVLVDQEPYSNAWADLGVFIARGIPEHPRHARHGTRVVREVRPTSRWTRCGSTASRSRRRSRRTQRVPCAWSFGPRAARKT